MGANENAAVARRMVEEILNDWDPAKVDGAFAESFVNHQRGLGPTGGRDELKEFIGGVRASFPDLRFEIANIVSEGDVVALHLVARGTHLGEFAGIPATGKRVEFAGMGFIRFAEGKVVERWNVQDVAGLMAQIREE